MKAGRELDALIAEKVMGIEVQKDQVTRGYLATKSADDPWDYFHGKTSGRIHPYSTDIKAAFEVVEKIGRTWNGFPFMLQWSEDAFGAPCWEAGWYEWSFGEVESRIRGTGDTPALAICLAALQSVPERKDDQG